ncbi:MAG: YfhO family protein, partial [Bacteroidetes bacterium]|nr:YfhO family protein [Bacteroidota bacterium]
IDPFKDASTSFFHKSIGGYHGAKLKRYQELIDFQIQPEMNRLFNTLRSEADLGKIKNVLKNLPVLNMLNTKYFIIMSNAGPTSVMNPYAMGPAWFVKAYEYVQNADEEIIAVGDIDPIVTAVIDERFRDELGEIIFQADTSASIALSDYKPNHLTYTSNTSSDQLAIFSEVYYPAGWNAYIDGQLKPHFRANWTLRAMIIPAGNHTVEFKFEPTIYSTGEKISLISSVILLLLVLVYVVVEIRKKL